jgi:hypothetical protein
VERLRRHFFPSVRMTVVLMAMAERGITIPATA